MTVRWLVTAKRPGRGKAQLGQKEINGSSQMHKIVLKETISPTVKLYEVEAPKIARKALPGQFILLRIDEAGERIPLTIADFDPEKGTITLVVQEVGKTTMQMGTLSEGEAFRDVVGPLGMPSHLEGFKKVIMVGGGIGIAPIFPITRAFHQRGAQVISIIGARSQDLLFFEERMAAVSDELIITTDDGSKGRQGVVTEPLTEILERDKDVDVVYAIGPAIMMKFVSLATKPFQVPTVVSLNSLMVDGTGMCGGCRVDVGGEIKFACVDGPEFDGHEVDFDLLMARQRMYVDEERQAVERFHEKCRLKEQVPAQ
jgi:ferredoxin/flavodoxin---NADP+ reductase